MQKEVAAFAAQDFLWDMMGYVFPQQHHSFHSMTKKQALASI